MEATKDMIKAEALKAELSTGVRASTREMIKETLILRKNVDEFGKALVEDCPDNDCVIFRNVYLRYCELLADYKAILGADLGLFDSTKRVLEHGIYQEECKLLDMWKTNYAVYVHKYKLNLI